MKAKGRPFVGVQRERLLLALVAEDALNILNTVFKTRGLTIHIDYTTNTPKLLVSRPGVEPEVFMTADARTKKTWYMPIVNEQLQLALTDLLERLAKIEAHLLFVIQKDKQQRKWAKLQLHVAGSRGTAITILDINRGHKISDSEFCLPGA